jgi:hypothetical protein
VRVPWVEATAGATYDVGGPEVLTYEDLMRQYADLVGRRPIIVRVPVLSPSLSARWLWLVTSVPTSIARALIEGLTQDVIAEDRAIRELVPQRLLGFRESVQRALDAEREHRVVARWVEGSFAARNARSDYGFYAKKVRGSALVAEPADRVWTVVSGFAGRHGHLYLEPLWTLRRGMDWLLGGPSFRRGRRASDALRAGDVVDAWRVLAVEPGHRLTLLMEMKTPGSGVLEFDLRPEGERTRVVATSYFHPAGFWGLLYWYLLWPFHLLIFAGMGRAIGRRAQAEVARRIRSRRGGQEGGQGQAHSEQQTVGHGPAEGGDDRRS